MDMQTQKANWVQYVTGLLVLIVGIGLFTGAFTPEPQRIPTPIEIAAAIDMPVFPTTEELAALIPAQIKPDTFYSVRDEKQTEADRLATDEFDERDFRDDLAERISDSCDGTDIDRNDITSISIRESDYRTMFDTVRVTYELKVYFDNFGDDEETEWARVEVEVRVTDLDWDDDFEDAEVDEVTIQDVLRCSTD